MADYENKMEYTQADGALTTAWKTVTFSIDGTNEIKANAVKIKNEDTSGTNKLLVAINSNETTVITLGYGESVTYAIQKVKGLRVKYSGGAPNFRINGVR